MSRQTTTNFVAKTVHCANCGADLGYPFASTADTGHVCPPTSESVPVLSTPADDPRWDEEVRITRRDLHALLARAVAASAEDHTPNIGSWIDDSAWLTCSCGWDSSEEKALGWADHIAALPSEAHRGRRPIVVETTLSERAKRRAEAKVKRLLPQRTVTVTSKALAHALAELRARPGWSRMPTRSMAEAVLDIIKEAHRG